MNVMKLTSNRLKNSILARIEEFKLRRSDRRGPDFICFGMQKAGTRWLFQQMNARRDVWMPPIKEINFFNGSCLKAGNIRTLERNTGSLPLVEHPANRLKRLKFCQHFGTYNESRSGMEWYRKLFDHKGQMISGDVSPSYSEVEPDEIRRLVKELPRVKYILLIREKLSEYSAEEIKACAEVFGGHAVKWREKRLGNRA